MSIVDVLNYGEVLVGIVLYLDLDTLRKLYYIEDYPLHKQVTKFLSTKYALSCLVKSWNLEKYKIFSFGGFLRIATRKRLFDRRNSIEYIMSRMKESITMEYTKKLRRLGRSLRLDVIEKVVEGMSMTQQCRYNLFEITTSMYMNVEEGNRLIELYSSKVCPVEKPNRSVLRWFNYSLERYIAIQKETLLQEEFLRNNGKATSLNTIVAHFRYGKWDHITSNPENETYECICIRSGRPNFLKNPELHHATCTALSSCAGGVPERVRLLFRQHRVKNDDGSLWKDPVRRKHWNFRRNRKFSSKSLARYNLVDVL